jgi:hypothetical protein
MVCHTPFGGAEIHTKVSEYAMSVKRLTINELERNDLGKATVWKPTTSPGDGSKLGENDDLCHFAPRARPGAANCDTLQLVVWGSFVFQELSPLESRTKGEAAV